MPQHCEAFIRLDPAADDVEQSSLSATVITDKGNFIAFTDLEIDGIEQGLLTEGFSQVFSGSEFYANPQRCIGAC